MTRHALHMLAAVSVVGLNTIAVVRWRQALPAITVRAPRIAPLSRPPSDSLDETLASAEESIVLNDPFRLANVPATARYDPNQELGVATSSTAQTAAPHPMLTLRAIVGGPPWQAVVDGLPGQPANTIVRAGSTFDKLVARSVTRDSVVIQGPDTTWVLRFRRPE